MRASEIGGGAGGTGGGGGGGRGGGGGGARGPPPPPPPPPHLFKGGRRTLGLWGCAATLCAWGVGAISFINGGYHAH